MAAHADPQHCVKTDHVNTESCRRWIWRLEAITATISDLCELRYTNAPMGGNDPVERSVAIAGDDGFVYLMRATSPAIVYVISSAGEVMRKIVVSAPTDGASPDFGIREVKNKLVVKFLRNCSSTLTVPPLGSCHGTVYSVVDATTGRRIADYEAGDEVGGPIACYAPDPDRFFTFDISVDQHRLEMVEAGSK